MYSVSRVTQSDVEDIMKFMKRIFFTSEPLCTTVGYCQSESEETPDMDDFLHSCLPDESIQAKDGDGNIVGVLICGPVPLLNPGVNLNELKSCRSPKYKKFVQMMFLREMILEIWNVYPNDDRVFEIKLACTDPKWRKKGIMNALMKEAENAAKELNIRLMRIDTTSAYSAKSAERLGFKCVFSRAYKDLTLDGKPLIVPAPPHVEDKVFVKELY
ncbi:dopamine N-acetyltransferase-like [Zerene cesonia]|uniref:dopamine N-acetyltransferase-like n=1 Tax=Zerene cesonia TaxID=33412 RepID=UPI0018E51B67|nr:dopamine N-acetyltransferase-like [Zerene cesonia]